MPKNPYGFVPDKRDALLNIAVDALRKIRLGHPCDFPVGIASAALSKLAGEMAS